MLNAHQLLVLESFLNRFVMISKLIQLKLLGHQPPAMLGTFGAISTSSRSRGQANQLQSVIVQFYLLIKVGSGHCRIEERL